MLDRWIDAFMRLDGYFQVIFILIGIALVFAFYEVFFNGSKL